MERKKKVKRVYKRGKCSGNYYAVNAQLASTEGIFLFHFEWLGPFDEETSAMDILVSPLVAKAIAKALPAFIKSYEKEHGVIKGKLKA